MSLVRYGSAAILMLSCSLSCSLSGCAMLYSETRDKQAQEAQQAWEKVDLASQIAVPRKNLSALLGQQLALEDELLRARRDAIARALATGGTVQETLVAPLTKLIGELAGSAEAAKKWQRVRADIEEQQELMRAPVRSLRWIGFEPPACAQIHSPASDKVVQEWAATATRPRAGILTASIKAMKNICTKLGELTTVGVLTSGSMKQSEDNLRTEAAALEVQRSRSLELRNRYRIASAEYDAAAAAMTDTSAVASANVRRAAEKLRSLAQVLEGLDDAFSVQFIAEQKRDAVNQLLSAVLDTKPGTPLPEHASKAAMVLVVFPDLFDKAQASLADANKPHLAPFLLQKKIEQIKADTAARDVDAERKKIALLEEKLEAQARQADSCMLALSALERNPLKGQQASVALAPVKQPGEEKMQVWRATAFYLDAIGRLHSEERKIDYKLTALTSERGLAYAESSVMQWGALINANVAQMSEFGSAGIRKEHLTALLNSASLLAIGIGTNK